MIGGNRRKLLKTVDDSFNELYETKQNKVWYSDAEGITVVPTDWESYDGLPSVYVVGNLSPIPQMEDTVFVQGVFVVDEYGNLEIDPYNVEIK